MKILNITQPENFFKTLEKCKGSIFLVTKDGDQLNLKSKLCQYVALSSIFSEAKIDDIELVFSEPEDCNLLLDYLIRG